MKDSRGTPIFWPIILITVGVIWLLSNFDILPRFNYSLLFDLWPLLLIVGGINLLLGKRLAWLKAVVTLAAVALAVLYVFFAPSLGLAQVPEVQEAQLAEPIGEATSARINIDSSLGRTRITPLKDDTQLFEADLKYVGDLIFDVTGTTEKEIQLRTDTESFDSSLYNMLDEDQLRWNIGLTPNIPLSLEFSGGVGEIVLDLSGLQLTDLYVNGGVGDLEINIPANAEMYNVEIKGGVGSLHVIFAEGANVDVQINAGVGEFILEIPHDAGVDLVASTGVGQIRLPSNYINERTAEGLVNVSGAWKTDNFSIAEYFIYIDYSGGVGDLKIR